MQSAKFSSTYTKLYSVRALRRPRPFTDRLSQSDAEMLYSESAGIGDGGAEVGGKSSREDGESGPGEERSKCVPEL